VDTLFNSFCLSFYRYARMGFYWSLLPILVDVVLNGRISGRTFVEHFNWLLFLSGLVLALSALLWCNRETTWFARRVARLERNHGRCYIVATRRRHFLAESTRIDLNQGHTVGTLSFLLVYAVTYTASCVPSIFFWTWWLYIWISILLCLSWWCWCATEVVCHRCVSDLDRETQLIRECLRNEADWEDTVGEYEDEESKGDDF